MAEPTSTSEQLLSEEVHIILNVPLNSRDQLIGSSNLGNADPDVFSEENIEVAQEITNSLAVVARVSAALRNTHIPDEMLPVITNQIVEILGAQSAAIAVIAASAIQRAMLHQ